jgi:hypothetical protein
MDVKPEIRMMRLFNENLGLAVAVVVVVASANGCREESERMFGRGPSQA